MTESTGPTGLMTQVLAGAGAGLGVAVPVGAIGVLLIQEGMRGRRTAVAAACAVAVVDLLYAAVAVALGPLVATVLAGWEAWVRMAAALVLVVIAGRGLRSSFAAEPAGPQQPGPASAAVRPTAAPTFVRFAALTLVNPTTALYFAAMTTAQGAALASPAAAALFLGGVFAASLVWQQLLVAAAAYAGSRFPPSVRAWTFRFGYGLVAVYAAAIAWPLP
jgi:arginine exporter protein ArgO